MVDRHESRSLTQPQPAAWLVKFSSGVQTLVFEASTLDLGPDDKVTPLYAQSEIALKWRPVSEEPPCANRYIVTLTYPDGETRVQERYFATSRKWDSEYVTHWMHMPMPAVEANRQESEPK